MYYIQDSRQFVGNSMLWWRPDRCGYTCNLSEAGAFTLGEAKRICRNRDTDRMWEINYINSKTQHHVDMQDVTLKRSGPDE